MTFDLTPGTLRGDRIQLEPYADAIRDAVGAALDCDREGWRLFAINGQGASFNSWWTSITAEIEIGRWVAYAIRDLATDEIVGTSSFLNIRRDRSSVEIGGTFLHPRVRSGYTNPESKRLMLDHAFSRGARRIEFLTDLRNERSQFALGKLGAVREGILRRDRQTWTGHIRDSVIFSITDLDWPTVKSKLDRRLAQLAQ